MELPDPNTLRQATPIPISDKFDASVASAVMTAEVSTSPPVGTPRGNVGLCTPASPRTVEHAA
jgi:hypothetical protein